MIAYAAHGSFDLGQRAACNVQPKPLASGGELFLG